VQPEQDAGPLELKVDFVSDEGDKDNAQSLPSSFAAETMRDEDVSKPPEIA
jgi:hypothetical protein